MRHLSWYIFFITVLTLGASLSWYNYELSSSLSNYFESRTTASVLDFQLKTSEMIKENELGTIVFVGDVMLGRGVEVKVMEAGGDFRWPFFHAVDFLREADLVVGNLEGPISSRGVNQGSIYSFRFKPASMEGLKFAGFDVLTLANNHIWDYGAEALMDTASLLEINGIKSTGAGRNLEEAERPVIKRVGGAKVAILAYTNLYPSGLTAGENSPGISRFDIDLIGEAARNLKNSEAADLVVVALHWGEEYETKANLWQRQTAEKLVGMGVDLIVGHHPHVMQEVEEILPGKWAAYSLGNFVFDQNFSEETMRGEALLVDINGRDIANVETVPYLINSDFQPVF